MPMFNFLCNSCGAITSELFRVKEKKTPVPCNECGKKTEITFQNPRGLQGGSKERISTALGVHVSQIKDGSVFKVHPGARFNHNGDMILKDLGEQKQRLRERGWVDKHDGKGWY
jgi:putative FmdB family regulatory protein